MTTEKQTGTELGPLLVRLVFATVIILLVHYGWPTEWNYRFQHNEHTKIVPAGPQPEDCDFLTAPLGSKGCHYDKQPVYDEASNTVYLTWTKAVDGAQ